jgi:flagellar biosynthesis protein FlhF
VRCASGRSIIIDTAGVTPGDEAARAALATLIEASAAQPLLVLPADTAAAEAAAMAAFYAPLGATTLLATRLDLAQRMGGMLAATDAGRLALPAAGMTPHFAYGLVALSPGMLARRLLAPALSGVPL